MTAPELKPCPFCGWDAPYIRTTGIETEVYCESCTAVGPLVHSVGPNEDVDEVAIRLWNRRAEHSIITGAKEALEIAREHRDIRTWNAAIRAAKDVIAEMQEKSMMENAYIAACDEAMEGIVALLKEEPHVKE